MVDRSTRTRERRAPDIVRWGPVVARAVIGLAVFAMPDARRLAAAASGNGGWVRADRTWLLVASAP